MLRDYFAERMPPLLFVPLGVALTIAAHIGVGRRSIDDFVVDATLVLVLLAQFRLWDDLVDRERDAIGHPERTLVRAASIAPFQALAVALAALNTAAIAWLYGRWTAWVVFAALTGGMAVFYAQRRTRTTLGDHIVLAKYPAFVLIVGAGRLITRPWLMVCTAAAVYLAACVYEAVHDPSSPASANTPLVVGEVFLLMVSSVAAIAIGAQP